MGSLKNKIKGGGRIAPIVLSTKQAEESSG
jgi:hypothetical protein